MKNLVVILLLTSLTRADEAALQEFTNGNNLFTAAIYKEISKESKGNFLFSPFSVETVLALTQAGSKGDTASEIRDGLHLPSTPEKTEAVFRSVLPALKGSDQYALHTANKIYVKHNFPLKEEFKSKASEVFGAGVEGIDFSLKTEAADTVNKWVEGQTNGKISNLIDPSNLDTDTRLVLVNALYFKGKWSAPFDFFATTKRDFYTSAKEAVQVDTMYTTDLYNYYESEELNAKFLEMRYQGGDISMVIVLPNDKEGLPALEGQLEKVFTAPKFSMERVAVSLPRFTIETKVQLKPTLENLGIKKAFTNEADLSGIAGKKGDLSISHVVQKAFINVTETGTEAAAATAAVVVTLSLPPPQEYIKHFKIDHPFFFYLKMRKQNLVLFAGKYVSP